MLQNRRCLYDREIIAATLRDEMALDVAAVARYFAVNRRTASRYIRSGRFTIGQHRAMYREITTQPTHNLSAGIATGGHMFRALLHKVGIDTPPELGFQDEKGVRCIFDFGEDREDKVICQVDGVNCVTLSYWAKGQTPRVIFIGFMEDMPEVRQLVRTEPGLGLVMEHQ